MIPFTGFAPDNDPMTPGIIVDCVNLVPTLRGYAGGPSGVDVGMSALAAAALSAALVVKLDASTRLFAGTATKLYEKSGTTWTDVSRVAAYNASTVYPWRFAQFGNTTLAVNKGDVLQSSSTGIFANLTAPKAAVMCVASGFVMLGNTSEATYGDSLNRWWCSALRNEADWVPNIATQCTTGQLVDTPGAITAMRAFGDNVVAFKDRSMYVAQYVGAPGVWQFNMVQGEIGCSSHEAIADVGTALVFVGYEDIYLLNGGYIPQPIGAGLRKWFFNDLDPGNRHRIRHSHDRAISTVYFYYPRVNGGGALTGCIAYNYKSNKWGLAHKTIACSVEYVTGGYTWDTLPIINLTWDDWPQVPYDSPFWTAATQYTAYVGTDNKVYSLTGGSLSASFTTGDHGAENLYSQLTRVTLRYLQVPVTASMTNYYQTVHGGAWTTGATTGESNGRFNVLRSAPWHRAKFTFTGDFEVTAANADIKPGGVL